MDHCGPLSWSVEDAALSLQVMAGFDPLDPASANVSVPNYCADLGRGVKGLKLGYVANWLAEDENANPEIKTALMTALDVFRAEGAIVEAVTLPSHDLFHACGRLIILAECYAIHEKDLIARPELYGRPTRERLMAGAFVRGSDYVEALRLRREMALQFNAEILGKYDAVIAPATSQTAGRFDAQPNDPLALTGYMTVPFNVTGNPAMSVCCGFTANGLPISLQVVGKPFDEPMVLRVGAAYESASDWRRQRPINKT
jgi:aspartyl-tRNA(Asn)/glutamyl-tRNA(Gln) amidotransferase subunit A